MKNFIASFILISIFFISHAQQYHPLMVPGVVWSQEDGWCGWNDSWEGEGYGWKIYLGDDTTIGSVTYRNLWIQNV